MIKAVIVSALRIGTVSSNNSQIFWPIRPFSIFMASSPKSEMMAQLGLAGKSTRRLLCIANHCKSIGYTPANVPERVLGPGSVCPPTKPGVMRLYNMRFCPFAQRTRLVLEYKKIPYEIVNLNLKHKADWFVAKNPQGLVPILEIDGQVIYESTATCEWLDDMYPENRLQPSDPTRKAHDRMLFEYFGSLAGNLHKVLRRPDQRDSILKRIMKNLQYYEDVLAERGGPFFGGSKLAMIDFYLWPHIERIPAFSMIVPEVEISATKHPYLANWYKCMFERPEVKATIMDKEAHLQFITSLASGSPDYDYGLAA